MNTTISCALLFITSCAFGQQTAAIDAIREYVLNYTKNLPNYTCTLRTTRTIQQPNAIQSLRSTVIEEQLSFVEGKERRRITQINERPASREPDYQPVGMSRGEFGNILDIIFEPATAADLRWDRADTLNGRGVDVVAFHVPQSRGYVLKGSRGNLQVPFEGFVYADAQTHAVLRIQLKCTMIPNDSEIRNVDLSLDYQAAQVAGREFILPSHFVLHYVDSRNRRHTNDARYSAYRRFDADATIQFEGDKQ